MNNEEQKKQIATGTPLKNIDEPIWNKPISEINIPYVLLLTFLLN